MHYHTLIKNGTIIDGTGRPPFFGNIGIADEKIAIFAEGDIPEADVIIDARKKYIVPGFIDILSHADNYWSLFDPMAGVSLLSQGVTTIIGGNCGSSLAPLVSPASLESVEKWTHPSKISVHWNSFGEYLHFLDRLALPVNFGSLVGHTTLRRGYLKNDDRPLLPSELESLAYLLTTSLQEGAFGLSTGLGYAHAKNTSKEELTTFLRIVKEHDALYSAHLRHEGRDLVKSVDEVIEYAKDTQVRLEISHLKSKGQKNWDEIHEAIDHIHDAAHAGIDIHFDVYPYNFTLSVLYPYLPAFATEGGVTSMLEKIRGKITRKQIKEALEADREHMKRLIVARADGLANIVGKTFEDIARDQDVSVEEALLTALESSDGRVLVFDMSLHQETVLRLLFDAESIIASDDGFYSQIPQMGELIHPRAFGAFPKFLEFNQATHTLTWEEAIAKMTGKVAKQLHLKKRGTLQNGMQADIVMLDPQKVGSEATMQNPMVRAQGIESVWVNGALAYESGIVRQRSGRTLRHGAS